MGVLLITLLFLAAGPARAAATCADVQRVGDRWDEIGGLIDKQVEKHGAHELPKAVVAQVGRLKRFVAAYAIRRAQ
jgi:KaiC/GvpD/RAD55 family RecA-like ATPase